MKFSFYIAKRYLFKGSKNNAINIITGIASVGIVVGTTALFVVLSVFSGLKDFSLSFSNDFDPDLKATSIEGKSFFISQDQETKLKETKGLAFYSKIIEERTLFTFNGKDQLAYIKGVDSNYIKVNEVQKTIQFGTWPEPESYQVVVGYGIAQKLSMGLMDMVNVFEAFVPKPGKGAIENPNDAFNRSVIVPVGVYFINEDINQKYVFCNLDIAQDLLEFKENQISGLEFKLEKGADEKNAIEAIEQIFPNTLQVKNRIQLNESLYRMLNTENLILYLLFTLVIAVTLFTLIGAISMIIIEKKPNLKTLFGLGAEINKLKNIFLLQGSLICLIGGFLGLFIGIIIVWVQQKYSLVMITQEMAYPVLFTIQNVVIVLATIFLLGFIASWIASSRVNQKFLN